MKDRYAILISGIVLSFALTLGVMFAYERFWGSESSLIESAKTSVRSGLFDPYSAQFEDLTVARNTNGGEFVCGFVNAKNKMGGYVGRAPFVYAATAQRSMIIRDSRDAFVAGDYMVGPCFPRMEVPDKAPRPDEPVRILGQVR
jgi:hypothetical protein